MPELVVDAEERSAVLVLTDGEQISSAVALIFLARRGVRYGHLPSELARLAELTGPVELVVASAMPAVPPEDARLELPLGNTAAPFEPLRLADSEWELSAPATPEVVIPGDVVAVKYEAKPGHAGRTVTGKPFGEEPPPAADIEFMAGAGVELSADGLTAVATSPGNVRFRDGVVEVVPETRIEGDVEGLLDEIVVEGNLLVSGDVTGPRRIVATGDVTVMGGLEGVTVEAGGRIVVHGGVRHRSVLTAPDAVMALFVEHSQISNTRFLAVRQDLIQSQVNEVAIAFVGASIVGGAAQLQERLRVRTLGGPRQTPTRINVVPIPAGPGPHVAINRERQELSVTLAQVRIKLDEANRTVSRRPRDEEAAALVQQLAVLYRSLMMKDEALAQRLIEVSQEVVEPIRPEVEVGGEILPGVSIMLGLAQLKVETAYPACRLTEGPGMVQMVPLERPWS